MIYLLEDDDSIRDLVIYTLQSQGMEAKGFPRPSAFWEAMAEHTPSLVLLDIMLPEEDGISVLKKLRASARAARLPIIMLTAKGTEYDKVLGLDAGADAVMILPPYYFHFGPEALLQYYDRLARQIHGPIYIYNFPDNTGYTIPAETVAKLAQLHSNIVGMKDTVSGMDHTRELIKVVKSHIPTFEIYSGFDDNFAHNVMAGGNGCIGALSNVVPEICAAWVKAFRDNDMAGVAKGQQTIDRLMDLYAVRSPFLPVIKEACKLRGIAATSVGTFPMPNATVEDDAKILELLRREGVE